LGAIRKILKNFLQKIFRKPAIWLANQFSSKPDKDAIFYSLSDLFYRITTKKTDGQTIPFSFSDRFIIFSDQHKGSRDYADDFRLSEHNYRAALQFYLEENYTLFNLGDCEELWENTEKVAVDANLEILAMEAAFLEKGRYYRTFGNHDLAWKFSFPRNLYLKPIFGDKLNICEGFVLKTSWKNTDYHILLTHGHQGDKRSDTNAFSAWFVAAIWTPIQRFLEVSVNTVAKSYELGDRHNKIYYDWALTQENLLLITGHTHKPVFASLDHIEKLELAIEKATAEGNHDRLQILVNELALRKKEYAGKEISRVEVLPKYFNSGCCCFSDGDITGIEIADGEIRLIKWKEEGDDKKPVRKVLEWSPLEFIFECSHAAPAPKSESLNLSS
jgi:UDP-2,3-diacylglucosamine pyrophosphatase LpxH